MKKYFLVLIICILAYNIETYSQAENFTAVRSGVDFSAKVRFWDGFGFNYVQSAHFLDKNTDPKGFTEWWDKTHPGKNPENFVQEYGGFSLLNETQKKEIIRLVFGEEGLKPGVVKMFLDGKQQKEPFGPYDHKTTTDHMRYFVKEGLKLTRERGADFQIITTLYGPPGFMTMQKADRGRDLDPAFKTELALYMINWVKYLKEEEKLPVKFLSVNNEGEDWHRWTKDGMSEGFKHDFNLYWSPELINEYMKMMPKLLKKHGVGDVGITPGEPSNWYRFAGWGYADFLANDKEAVKSLGLITSHGFYRGTYGHWFGEHNSYTNDILRAQRPELHSWVTSTSWAAMDAQFVKQIHGNIYTSKVNAIIPWAGIQRPTHWIGGDPNPGNAIQVNEDGTYEVRKGYYFYKQASRAGQPGMMVVRTYAMNSEVGVIGFSQNGTKNPDSFIVINIASGKKPMSVEIKGSKYKKFEAFRTVDAAGYEAERYKPIGIFEVINGAIFTETPPGSVTTFFGKE